MRLERKARRSRDERESLVLDTAERMFYAAGVHEIGMDALIAETGLGKATVYRLYATKAELVGAYLDRLSARILTMIDADIDTFPPAAALGRILDAIEADVGRRGFRGCPFNNASSEFADPAHPARAVARRYRKELLSRLTALSIQVTGDDLAGRTLGGQLAALIDGAYTSGAHLGPDGPARDGLALARSLADRAADQRSAR